MRAEAVGGDLACVQQPFAVELVHPEQTTTRIGRVVFSGIQVFAVLVHHGVAVKVPVRLRGHGLQQLAVAQVDQVTLGARTPCDEQRQRLRRVIDDVMATLTDVGGEHPRAVEAITDRVMLAIGVVARRQQQRALILAFEQRPAAQRHCSQQCTS